MADTLIYRKAETEDLSVVTDFVVGCIRYAFTRTLKLGPQEYYASDIFPLDYYGIRQKSLSNPTTLSSMAIDPETNQVVGYIEFGPKKPYFKDIDCQSEILCYFVSNQIQGKGVGKHLLGNIIQQALDNDTFSLGQDSVGILTLKGNPSITTFYKRIGAFPVQEHEWNVSLF
jgi:GNAT superfamily N-acetyltransferase